MKGIKHFAAVAAAALAAQPSAAAEGFRPAHPHVTSAFAGATLKLAAGNRQKAPSVQLGLGISQTIRYAGSAASIHMPGFELRLAPAGKAQFLVAGQSPSPDKHRFGFGPGTALLAIGGLAAGALVVTAMSGGGAKQEEDELERPQCFLPEKELCR